MSESEGDRDVLPIPDKPYDGEVDADHLITPEERPRVAMARQ